MNVALFLEIKQEYTEHLVDTLTPFIYEGLNSYYKQAVDIAEAEKSFNQTLLIFQKLLTAVDNWTQHKIEEETNRIKQMSGTSEYLDDLVRGVVKSNIILLTYSNNISNIVAQTFYNSLSTANLIHRCYIECAKDAHNNPYLFFHDVNPMDLKRNQIMIEKNIQTAIVRGIRKILPIGLMLKEYLSNSINIICEPPNVELVGHDPSKPQDIMAPAIKPDQQVPILSPKGTKTPQKPVVQAPIPVPVQTQVPQPQSKAISDKKTKIEQDILKMVKTENEKSDKEKVKALIQMDKIVNADIKKVTQKGGIEKSSGYTPNKKLNKSDKAIININFNDESTDDSSSKSSSKSVTSISDKPHSKHVNKDIKSDYIEEYGMPTDYVKKHRRQ